MVDATGAKHLAVEYGDDARGPAATRDEFAVLQIASSEGPVLVEHGRTVGWTRAGDDPPVENVAALIRQAPNGERCRLARLGRKPRVDHLETAGVGGWAFDLNGADLGSPARVAGQGRGRSKGNGEQGPAKRDVDSARRARAHVPRKKPRSSRERRTEARARRGARGRSQWSHSPPIMFTDPKIGTTSESIPPWMSCETPPTTEKHGGRMRTR